MNGRLAIPLLVMVLVVSGLVAWPGSPSAATSAAPRVASPPAIGTAAVGTAAVGTAAVGTAALAPCDPPVSSAVACENTKPGNPESEWGISGAGSASIQGFATDISVDQGGTVGFKVDTAASSYRLDIYRMGYYDGDGARKVGHACCRRC